MSRDFDELLSAYLDGEVSPEERAAVEQRLEQSPALRETLDELSEVGDLIRGLPRARPPVDLPERVVAAIAPKPLASAAHAKRRRLFGVWPVMAAGSVLAAGVAIVVLLPGDAAKGRRVTTSDGLALAEKAPAGSLPKAPVAMTTAVETGATTSNSLVTASPHVQSLTDYVRNLGRDPLPGEVLSTLYGNAGQTQVLKYTVVDTRRMAGTMKTILADNSFDIVVTETPAAVAGTAVPPVGGSQLVYYVEGSPEQIGQALDAIETLPDFRDVQDLGTLWQDSEANSALFFGTQTGLAASKPAGEPELQENLGRPITAPKIEAPAAAPADRPVASRFAASEASEPAAQKNMAPESRTLKESENNFSDQRETKPAADTKALPSSAAQPVPAPAPMPEILAAPAPAQVANGRGVSAQIDSQAAMPIVENMLRTRSQGNGVQANGGQGNGLQRGLAGQSQNYSFRRSRSNGVVQENPAGNAPATSRNEVERLKEANGSLGLGLKQQQSAAEPLAGNVDLTDRAAIANPRNGASQEPRVHALIILEPEPAQPATAAPALPAVPAEKKKASN